MSPSPLSTSIIISIISISILVTVFFLSQDVLWSLWSQRGLYCFINESDFLLSCYGNKSTLSCLFGFCLMTYAHDYDAAYQSTQSSRNRFPPYRPVQNENRTKMNIIYSIIICRRLDSNPGPQRRRRLTYQWARSPRKKLDKQKRMLYRLYY